VLTGTTGDGAAGISVSFRFGLGQQYDHRHRGPGQRDDSRQVADFPDWGQRFPDRHARFQQRQFDRPGPECRGVAVCQPEGDRRSQCRRRSGRHQGDDQAIGDISTLRGRLGAFQIEHPGIDSKQLRATLENTTAAESIIRDTDFAAETANLTKNQVLVQAGTTVLSQANNSAQLLLCSAAALIAY